MQTENKNEEKTSKIYWLTQHIQDLQKAMTNAIHKNAYKSHIRDPLLPANMKR